MPIENDEGGGGGGTTTIVCTPNPSDNLAILNNILSRVSDIEKFLSQLVGADVHADNLSELADNIGNILNGTITLPSDGNSPYGTGGSIPVPDGFSGTVISGNIITTWENGVVSFQVIPGSGVTAGVSGGTPFGIWRNSGVGDSITNGTLSFDLTINSEVVDVDGIGSLASNLVTVASSGYYEISAKCFSFKATAINGAETLILTAGGTVFNSSYGFTTAVGLGTIDLFMPCVTLFLTAGQTIKLELNNTTGGTVVVTVNQLVVKKLS